jgi:hypothetical protein
VIRYKPVAKLSGKSGAKKGGQRGGGGNNAAPVVNGVSNNNNNSIVTYNPIAFISWDEPDRGENSLESDDFYEKIEELNAINDDIFFIEKKEIFNRLTRPSVEIYFHNFSKIKKNNTNYKTKLEGLIRLLIYFRKASSPPNLMGVEVILFSPNADDYTPEYNEFLSILATKIYPNRTNS